MAKTRNIKKAAQAYFPLGFLMAFTVLVNLLGSEAIFHPDSFAVTGSALRAIENNGDPGWYMYPAGLLIYLNSLIYGFIFFILELFGQLNSFSEFWSMYCIMRMC